MMRTVFVAATVLALAVSCGVGGGDDPRVQVAVRSTSWLTADVARSYALTNNSNLAVSLRITNNQMEPLALSLDRFVLGTADGYLFTTSPVTALYPQGCNPAASVQPGATVDCIAVFSFPGPKSVGHVGYQFPDKGDTTVRLSVPGCTLCGAWCIDTSNDMENCGTCGNAVPDGASCQNGKLACATGFSACNGRCVSLLTDPDNCGSCGKKVWGGTCKDGAPVCGWGSEVCGTGCTLTSSDPMNCGRCGATCPSTYACIGGQCACPTGHQVCGNGCKDLQYDESNCGSCGNTCKAGYDCSQGSCVYNSGGGGSGGGSGGGCSVNCGSFGLSCCGSSCC